MMARAVMKAWQESLGGAPPMGRIYRSEAVDHGTRQAYAQNEPERTPIASSGSVVLPADDRQDDPEIRVAKRKDFVPKRPGLASSSPPDESFWSSHHFWKGIVVGAVIVLLVKTAMAVNQSPGIDWYRF